MKKFLFVALALNQIVIKNTVNVIKKEKNVMLIVNVLIV